MGTCLNAPLVLNTAIGLVSDRLMYETIRVYSDFNVLCFSLVLANLFAVLYLVIMSQKCWLCVV